MRLKALPALFTILASAILASAAAVPAMATGTAPLAAEACLGCHGPEGRGAAGTPAVAGRGRAEPV
ncbi:hypothetical protein WDZ92_49035, partial [Nostoc sp. NIES-2111]